MRPGGDIIDEAEAEAAGDGEGANAVTAEAAEAGVLPLRPADPELGELLLGLATMVLNAVLMGVDEPIVGPVPEGRGWPAVEAVTAGVLTPEAATEAAEGGTDVVEAGTLFTTLLLLLLRTLLEFEMALDC